MPGWNDDEHPRQVNGKFSAGSDDFNTKNGTYKGAELTTSQHEYSDDIVRKKMRGTDFNVELSPEFSVDGRKMRAVMDGHHRLAAALAIGEKPTFSEADSRNYDTIGHLKKGDVDGFLDAHHKGEGDYYNPVTNKYTF